MEKYIPFEKLSKKKRRELYARRRGTWGELNPVTRRPENPKAYNRRKARKWSDDSISALLLKIFTLFANYITTKWGKFQVLYMGGPVGIVMQR